MRSACFRIRANHGVIETFAISGIAADVIFRKAHFSGNRSAFTFPQAARPLLNTAK
jgi:hypothetical protein